MFVYYAVWLNAKAGRLADRSGRRDKMLKSGSVPPNTGRMVSLLINRLKQFKKYFDENIIHERLVQSSKRIRWHYRTESEFRLIVRKIDVENSNSDFCLSRRRRSSVFQFLRRERSEYSRDKKLFLETRPWSDSLSGAKIMAQKPKIGKISIPTKGNHGYFLTIGYNPQADWSRDTAKNVPAIIVAGAGVKGFKIH